MTPIARSSLIIAFSICISVPAVAQQYYLYAPQPTESAQKTADTENILVKEIEVKKGDTLYGLSRKFSGKGMYFPQILLFNNIKNPHLIYPGATLKIPVSTKDDIDAASSAAQPVAPAVATKKSHSKPEAVHVDEKSKAVKPASTSNTDLSLSDLKKAGNGKSSLKRNKGKKTLAETAKKPAVVPVQVSHQTEEPAPSNSVSGQKLFESATKAYRKDDCKTALELFDRYLAENSASPLAADASLYKAECYLKLSAQ